MITAVRCRSSGRSGQPASASAMRVHATAHFWASSIEAPTVGGIGSFQLSGFQSQSRTHPPILEYERSALGSGSKYSAGSQRDGSTSLIEYRPAVRLLQNALAVGASGEDRADADDRDGLG